MAAGQKVNNVPITRVYRNNGNGEFEGLDLNFVGVYSGSVAWGDCNNDGYMDVLITGYTGTERVLKLYINDGSGNFSEEGSSFIGVENGSAVFGDYDNDGDLDVLLTGWTGTSRVTKLYKNNSLIPNNPPSTPGNLNTDFSGRNVIFSWSPSTDIETPQQSLTYNLRVGRAPGGNEIFSPMADHSTGFRKIVGLGNTNHLESWSLTLPDGLYCWSVQAIDQAYAGSLFANEQMFLFDGPPSAVKLYEPTASEGQVKIKWTKSFDADFLCYRIYMGTSPEPTSIVDSIFDINVNEKTFNDLNYGTKYYFKMTVVDIGYNESPFSLERSITPFAVSVPVKNKWNLMSVPIIRDENDLFQVFPTATSLAFLYYGELGYEAVDNVFDAPGFWLKFDQNQTVELSGAMIDYLKISTSEGWNIIGSISTPVSVSAITTDPPDIIISPFYEYENGYRIADTIQPGKGYWIKVNQDGLIKLRAGSD